MHHAITIFVSWVNFVNSHRIAIFSGIAAVPPGHMSHFVFCDIHAQNASFNFKKNSSYHNIII